MAGITVKRGSHHWSRAVPASWVGATDDLRRRFSKTPDDHPRFGD
jgi:hypothetical protein